MIPIITIHSRVVKSPWPFTFWCLNKYCKKLFIIINFYPGGLYGTRTRNNGVTGHRDNHFTNRPALVVRCNGAIVFLKVFINNYHSSLFMNPQTIEAIKITINIVIIISFILLFSVFFYYLNLSLIWYHQLHHNILYYFVSYS